MPITARQLQDRTHYLGSSDIAALFGLNPYASAVDVWLEKTGQLEPEQTTKTWLQLGNDFESVILDRAAKALGPLKRNQKRSARGLGVPIASHIDAVVRQTGRPVEAKTCGLWWPAPEEWGEPGTDEVPDRVIVQAQVHLLVSDQDLCHVVCMKWGLVQEMYEVPRKEPMIQTIIEYASQWWQRHVVEGIEPAGTPTLDVVRRRKREPGKTVDLPEELVKRWRQFVKAEGRCRKLKEAALAQVLNLMGDAEVGICNLGQVEYRETLRAGYTRPPTVSRSVRFKESKGQGAMVMTD